MPALLLREELAGLGSIWRLLDEEPWGLTREYGLLRIIAESGVRMDYKGVITVLESEARSMSTGKVTGVPN